MLGAMKQFHDETDTPAAAASAVIQASWRVIRIVRAAIESRRTTDLTMTQLQALAFLVSAPGASVSEVAAHLGLQMPTTSKVVESLVQQGRVARKSVPENRRKLSLHITAAGRRVMGSAGRPGVTRMAELLAELSERDLSTVNRAMFLLQPIVATASDGAAEQIAVDGRALATPSRSRGRSSSDLVLGDTLTVRPAMPRR
jgi:DNA-binding MarR family transcriptional regulator